MTNIDPLVANTVVSLFLVLGLAASFCGWRAYLRDAFRQEMFGLRDELFDFAASGAVAFDSQAYVRLRCMMNGLIRYSHRMTLGEAILPHMLSRDEAVPLRFNQWVDAISQLPAPTRQRLLDFDHRSNGLFVKYLLISSPVVLAAVGQIALMRRSVNFAKRFLETRAQLVEEDALREYEYDRGAALA
jgi:hypothetical protein